MSYVVRKVCKLQLKTRYPTYEIRHSSTIDLPAFPALIHFPALNMSRTVTLVDELGKKLSTTDILDAHTGLGKLHLAFSVYVFDPTKTQVLIQRRSQEKMLWPTIWANTCCSHPFEGESPSEAGERRLQEELGVRTHLSEGPRFVYRADDPWGTGVEHEYVTILIGTMDPKTPLRPDPMEVMETKWMNIDELLSDMTCEPHQYAPWFHIGLRKVLATLP